MGRAKLLAREKPYPFLDYLILDMIQKPINFAEKCVSREGLLSSWPLGGENFGTLKEMVVGPPHTAYRRSLQTTLCGCEGN